jgi:hypothetical protein
MSTNPVGPRAYVPQIQTNPPASKQRPLPGTFDDLLKAVTPEEAQALSEAFGPASPAAKGASHRGRHLDIRA